MRAFMFQGKASWTPNPTEVGSIPTRFAIRDNMAKIIELELHKRLDLDRTYGVCKLCGGSDFKLTMEDGGGVIGFECSDLDCPAEGIFEEEKHIVFELELNGDDNGTNS